MQKVIVRMALLEITAVFVAGFFIGRYYEASQYEVAQDENTEVKKKTKSLKLEDGKLIFDLKNWR